MVIFVLFPREFVIKITDCSTKWFETDWSQMSCFEVNSPDSSIRQSTVVSRDVERWQTTWQVVNNPRLLPHKTANPVPLPPQQAPTTTSTPPENCLLARQTLLAHPTVPNPGQHQRRWPFPALGAELQWVYTWLALLPHS